MWCSYADAQLYNKRTSGLTLSVPISKGRGVAEWVRPAFYDGIACVLAALAGTRLRANLFCLISTTSLSECPLSLQEKGTCLYL